MSLLLHTLKHLTACAVIYQSPGGKKGFKKYPSERGFESQLSWKKTTTYSAIFNTQTNTSLIKLLANLRLLSLLFDWFALKNQGQIMLGKKMSMKQN